MTKPQKQFSYLKDQEIDKDVKSLFDYISRLEYTETNPDGSRKGLVGETVLLKSGGNYYVEICVGSNTTTWRGILLSDTP